MTLFCVLYQRISSIESHTYMHYTCTVNVGFQVWQKAKPSFMDKYGKSKFIFNVLYVSNYGWIQVYVQRHSFNYCDESHIQVQNMFIVTSIQDSKTEFPN